MTYDLIVQLHEHAILEIIDRLTHHLDTNETPFNIYIDLIKALDTINHTYTRTLRNI